MGKSLVSCFFFIGPQCILVMFYKLFLVIFLFCLQIVLVFPSVNAVSLHEYVADRSLLAADEVVVAGVNDVSSDSSCMTFVFIDCTWYQVHKIATDPRLSGKFCFYIGFMVALLKLKSERPLLLVCLLGGLLFTTVIRLEVIWIGIVLLQSSPICNIGNYATSLFARYQRCNFNDQHH